LAELIVSVSGLRGIVGKTLTEDTAARYAAAFANHLQEGPVLVTRDGRATGPALAQAAFAALHRSGRETIDGQIAATPTTGVLVKHLNCAGAIQISASHNPAEYNGMKLFGPDGRVIPAAQGLLVKQQFDDLVGSDFTSSAAVHPHQSIDSYDSHLELILNTVNVERIRACRYPVLLDSNHGAGSLLGRKLLETLGCEVTVLGNKPDGQFEHPPEPTADNLVHVGQQVVDCGAVVGFCQDPDADRLALIDADGRYLGEEYSLALCADHVLQQRSGPIVTNCSTSRMVKDIATRHGAPFFHSAVGEANVCDEMIRRNAVFGGEGNGGPIDPRVGYVRDSFVGMAQVLDAMSHNQQPLSQWADTLPRYFIKKTTIAVQPNQIGELFDKLQLVFCVAESSRLDGLRLDWPDQWLLIRASNTEPIVRIVAEATSQNAVDKLCELTSQVLQS